jgi:hypothetical protein
MRRFSRSRVLALGFLLVSVTPAVGRAQEQRPLMAGWEQHFTVTWDAVERRGRPIVAGYVDNRSPYRVGNVRVLVDSVDDTGRIVDQRVSWVLGELGAGTRLYFEVPVSPAPRHRVSVFSYDRIDQAAMHMAP